MIDKALIGAIERALERNESYNDILESMINCGYQEQDVLEAYNLVMHHQQEVQKRPIMIQTKKESGLFKGQPAILEAQPRLPEFQAGQGIRIQEQIVKKEKNIRKFVWPVLLLIITAGLSALLVYIWEEIKSCKELNIADLAKNIFGINLSCRQLSLINAELYVAIGTFFVLFLITLILAFRKRD